MTGVLRYEPIIEGKKICKKCRVSKEVETNFSYHKTHKCYSGKCIACFNEERRLLRPIKSGRRENSIYIRQKECIKCNITKDVNINNFRKQAGSFSKVCKVCSDSNTLSKREKKLNIGNLPFDSIKNCIICKEDKLISEFSFSKAIGYYSSYCKTCDVNRKQERVNNMSDDEKEILLKKQREWHYNNKEKSSLTKYRKFDFNRNFQNDLSEEYIKEALEKSCSYCGFPSTGLDRIDNNLGHTQSNCIPCCWECNTARMNNFSYNEMLIIGKAIKEVKLKRVQE